MPENEINRLYLLTEDVLAAAAIHRYRQPMQIAMMAVAIGMAIALEVPEWARSALEEAADDKVAMNGRRTAAQRYAEIEEAGEAPPARRARR